MIREHAFNTRWCGVPVGIVDDPGFFALPTVEREAALAPYHWVEFAHLFDPSLPRAEQMHRAGFYWADAQIGFRISLRQTAAAAETESLAALTVHSGADRKLAIGELAWSDFEHERFLQLRDVTQESVTRRYRLWAADIVPQHKETCLEVSLDGEPQGWFLSTPREGNSLNLTLALLRRDSRISGLLLYAKALRYYAGMGFALGSARFGLSNTAVHNIYAALGARFTTPTGFWFWQRP